MLTIVTGARDAGKTIWLADHAGLDAGGILQRKIMAGGVVVGYDAVSLVDGESVWLLRALLGGNGQTGIRLGRFVLNEEGFATATAWIKRDLAAGCRPLVIDEIGRLELAGNGFHDAFRSALASGRDLLVAVRDTWLGEVRSAFGLGGEARLVRLPGGMKLANGEARLGANSRQHAENKEHHAKETIR